MRVYVSKRRWGIGILSLGLLMQSAWVLGQDDVQSLPSLQRRIIAAADKARASVVRVTWPHDRSDDSASGVIFTADGYVATYIYKAYRAPQSRYAVRIPPGQSVSVHLADGRTVAGVAVAAFSSVKDVDFDLIKITQDGVWPCAEIGRAEQVNPGDTCLALGILRGPNRSFLDREPSVRIGHVIPWGMPGMLRSSCSISTLDDRGGGLFDLEGRLIGINLYQPFSDYTTRSDPTTCHLDIKVVVENWKSLTNKKPPAEKPAANPPATDTGHSQDAAPSPDSPELAAVAAKARAATVAIASSRHGSSLGCSGTVVTPDGYIATCAHHQRLRGTDTTVFFSDGRTAAAKILGRDDQMDIGLVKITEPGPWPFVPLGKVGERKVGDPCIIAGYPNYLRKKGKPTLVVRGARIADTQRAPVELFCACQVWDGDSGGGLFDAKGRLLGVLSGAATPRSVLVYEGADQFAPLWDSLAKGPALDDPVPFDASPAAAAVRKAIERGPSIVCEVLGDGKRRALGTIVSKDGRVLTKASELYGDISCRLTDGRTLPATVREVAREHDLAVLKIDADGLPQIVWSERREIPVGTLVAALRFGQPPTVGVVSHSTRRSAPAIGYFGIGKVKDAGGGVEVEQLVSWWDPSIVKGLRENYELAGLESPIRVGDVILSIESRPVPNVRTFEQLTKPLANGYSGREVPFVIAGDPIRVTVRRDGKERSLRFPLPSTTWDVRDKTSPRNSSFPAVFDTDVSLSRDLCGGPLVDCEGRVVGITIALPESVVMESPVMSRTFVVPAIIARTVAERAK
jgi:S1-C subfamily serine protease